MGNRINRTKPDGQEIFLPFLPGRTGQNPLGLSGLSGRPDSKKKRGEANDQ